MKRVSLVAGLIVCIVFSAGSAASLMRTGQELLDDPDVSFPTFSPTLVGNSLVFGPGSIVRPILLELPLFSAGALSTSTVTSVSVVANVTRLTADFDPLFMIHDGAHYAMGNAFDNLNGGAGGWAGGEVLSDRWLLNGATFANVFDNAGYPSIGESFDVTIQYLLGPSSSTITVSYFGTSGAFTGAALDLSKALTFALVRDNETNEQVQLNSLAISSAAFDIPEPTTLALMALGVAGIGYSQRKQH